MIQGRNEGGVNTTLGSTYDFMMMTVLTLRI
jgi:hypothetical protein